MSSSSSTPGSTTRTYTKRLEGVKSTKELQSLVNKCIDYITNNTSDLKLVLREEEEEECDDDNENENVDGLTKDQATNMLQEFDQLLTPQKYSREGQKVESTVDKSNNEMIKLKKSMTLVQAYYDEQQQQQQQQKAMKSSKKKKMKNQEEEDDDEIKWIPIPVIDAMQTIFKQQHQGRKVGGKAEADTGCSEDYVDQLEDALSHTTLVFTPPPPATSSSSKDPEQIAFQQRLERLRLLQEEKKYTKLTNNIDTGKPVDDITARSMTYAASVGLNMIVAPISFGVFMYWFGGSLLDWIFVTTTPSDDVNEDGSHSSHHNPVDIKKVLIGVISGVIMLFIEMILFVIRTHEFESYQQQGSSKKSKNNNKKGGKNQHHNPFGYYTSETPKTTMVKN